MTAQIKELLIIDGHKTRMAFCPPVPVEHPRIHERSPDEILRDESRILDSTTCWRRYVGTWEIKDERFFLADLHGRFQLRGSTPVFADWFSGILRAPIGEILQYVHMGFGSVHERELLVEVKNGVVVKYRTIDNRKRRGGLRILFWLSIVAIAVWFTWLAWP